MLQTSAPLNETEIRARLAQGQTLGGMRGLSEEAADFIYAFSAFHHRQGAYDLARRGFRLLCTHRHTDAEAWAALGHSCKAAQEPQEALLAFLMSLTQRPSPEICIEAARLFIALNAPEEAQALIDAARTDVQRDRRGAPELHHDLAALEACLPRSGA